MDSLENTRKKINVIDKKIVALFEARMDAIKDVVAYKQKHHIAILDKKREQLLKKQNTTYFQKSEYIQYYQPVLDMMLKVSKQFQNQCLYHDVVGYQGIEGAFGHSAALACFPDAKLQRFKYFEDVIQAVETGEIAYGILPFENSLTGEVGEVSDLLFAHQVYIHDVWDMHIAHHLLGHTSTSLSKIKKIYSHPQAFLQCKTFLKGRDIELIPYPNTALAAQFVWEAKDDRVAAIASKQSAERFGLSVIEEDIHSHKHNTTRFIVVAKQPKLQGDYFQLMFTTNHDAGALAQAMNIIAEYDFNMESIRSRAVFEKPWTYYFLVEIKGDYQAEKTKTMLQALTYKCEELKYLGSYQKNGGKVCQHL
ncbi:MAG: bifunctional chorismate mutase/prephenate dehydratase [Breznakia sp.]